MEGNALKIDKGDVVRQLYGHKPTLAGLVVGWVMTASIEDAC